jgi:hypothetical protein
MGIRLGVIDTISPEHSPDWVETMPSEVSLAGAEEELRLELSEAHRREAATAKVLEIISRSTFNLQEVLDSLIESAVRLTGAEMGLIYRQDGEFYRAAASTGPLLSSPRS